MDLQTAINLLFGISSGLGMWLLNMLWQENKERKKETTAVSDRLSQTQILVAGDYVKKSEFDAKVDKLFEKLDVSVNLMEKILDDRRSGR